MSEGPGERRRKSWEITEHSTRNPLWLINKLFVSVQEVTDSMELSGANYVKVIQFSSTKEGQSREDRGGWSSQCHVASLQEGLGQCLTESGKCSRGEACKTQNRFGFVLKYCCLHRESKKEFLMNSVWEKQGITSQLLEICLGFCCLLCKLYQLGRIKAQGLWFSTLILHICFLSSSKLQRIFLSLKCYVAQDSTLDHFRYFLKIVTFCV